MLCSEARSFFNNYNLVLAGCSNPSIFVAFGRSTEEERSKDSLQVFRKSKTIYKCSGREGRNRNSGQIVTAYPWSSEKISKLKKEQLGKI